jgi:hypothetical protein
MRRSLVPVLLVVVVLVAPAAARAQGAVDRAAEALRASPVYVDPQAEEALSPAQAAKLRQAIAGSPEPIYVAILPARAARETGGSAAGVLRALHDVLGRDGTYAVVVGNQFRAGSTDLPRGAAAEAADAAFAAHRGEGVGAVLLDFVQRIRTRAAGGGGGDGDGGGGFGAGWLVLVVGGGALVFFVLRGLGRRRREDAELAEVREAARDDLVALADDVTGLEDAVEGNRQAEDEYRHALDSYERASRAYDRAKTPADMRAVSQALEEGRYSMTAAKARAEGREPPVRRPPCFFDPRHGPSTREVEWAPPGGTPRLVPACEADAQRTERGEEPVSREVLAGGRAVPYWAAPSYFGPWGGGFFGGFGGFLPGFFLGELLSGGWYGPPGGWDDGGNRGDFDGGDFGDFGGGDVGGGDFGGGDFGGGGGDF